jgi:four helix bundle protein
MVARASKGRDIQERTFRFGVRVVKMSNCLPRTTAGFVIGRQVIGSSTSVGANTEEADAAESTDDFIHKMKIALKEAQESRFWLRTIVESELLVDDEVKALRQESDELVRIINAIIKNTRRQ